MESGLWLKMIPDLGTWNLSKEVIKHEQGVAKQRKCLIQWALAGQRWDILSISKFNCIILCHISVV